MDWSRHGYTPEKGSDGDDQGALFGGTAGWDVNEVRITTVCDLLFSRLHGARGYRYCEQLHTYGAYM